MKLELPTKDQFLAHMKWSLYIAVPILIIVSLISNQDPNRELTKEFISENIDIIATVGEIKSMSLYRSTYVNGGVDRNGNVTHGYNIYRYKVKGSESSLLVTIRADKSENGARNDFSIKKIESF